MIQYLGKTILNIKVLSWAQKEERVGRERRERGEGVPCSRSTSGEGSFTTSLLSCWWDGKLQHVSLRLKVRALRFMKTDQFSQIGGS
jgi:hypothetical protein